MFRFPVLYTRGDEMDQIRCPECRNNFLPDQLMLASLERAGSAIAKCPYCQHVFVYSRKRIYKRPFKFLLFSLMGKGTPLKDGDLVQCGSELRYSARNHCVYERVVIPNGPQGYSERTIPKQIKTHEELCDYLARGKRE